MRHQDGKRTGLTISIASGKGGTGKTLVATSLALSIEDAETGTVLDCDVEEPNANVLLKLPIKETRPVLLPTPQIDESLCNHCGDCAEACAYNAIAVVRDRVLVFPELCHGCGACSYLCPPKAISEVGREVGVLEFANRDGLALVQGRLTIGEVAAPHIIKETKNHASPQGVNIIDASPGTSCPVVEAVKDTDFCLLVTEPTPFGLNDLALAVEMLIKLGIPHGVVINRDGVGDMGVEDYCRGKGIDVLLRIPLDSEIARFYSRGVPLVEGMPQWKDEFHELWRKIRDSLDEKGGK